MRSQPVVALVTLFVALVAGGCATGSRGQHPATLTVANHSLLTVCDVYLWKPELGWGRDHLDDRTPLGPGDARSFEVEAGRYNLQLDDCRRRTVYGRSNLLIRRNLRIDFQPVEVERDGRSYRRFARNPARSF